jgi:hypothetical protein
LVSLVPVEGGEDPVEGEPGGQGGEPARLLRADAVHGPAALPEPDGDGVGGLCPAPGNRNAPGAGSVARSALIEEGVEQFVGGLGVMPGGDDGGDRADEQSPRVEPVAVRHSRERGTGASGAPDHSEQFETGRDVSAQQCEFGTTEEEHIAVAERLVLFLGLGEGREFRLGALELTETEIGEGQPGSAFDAVAELRKRRQGGHSVLAGFGEVTVLKMQLGQGLVVPRGQPRWVIGLEICEGAVEQGDGFGQLPGVLLDSRQIGGRDQTGEAISGFGELAQLGSGRRGLARIRCPDDDEPESSHRTDEGIGGLGPEFFEQLRGRRELVPARKHPQVVV